jgi:arginine repressor
MLDNILIRVNPQNINYINRIMEGYEYLGIVTTVNREQGILMIRVTPDTCNEVKKIIANLPIKFEFV